MSIFDWLKTDKKLQAELKALVDRIMAESFVRASMAEKYEELLKEIYLRGLEPEAKLTQREKL